MAILKNQRHELFAQGLAKGLPAIQAYEEAGYVPDRGAASRLSANVSVQSRVTELQGKAAKRTEVTVETLTDELEQARGLAIAEKQSSAAVQATMGKAKLFGLIVEKHKHSGQIAVVTVTSEQLAKLDEHELAALEAAYPVLEKLGLVGGDTGPASAS